MQSTQAEAQPTNRISRDGALLAVVAAACLFGSTGTIAALGPDDLSAIAAGSWRSAIGAVLLVVVARIQQVPVWSYPLMNRWVWIGGIGVAGYQLAFFEAVDRTGVGLGTMITIGVGPVVAGLLDAFLRRRLPARAWLLGTAVAVGGVVFMTASASEADPVGIALAVVAACSFPLYGEAAQRLMVDRPVLPAMATVFGAGAILLAPVAVVTAPEAFASAGAIATIATLGVATLGLAYALWGFGLRTLDLSTVVTVTLVEPAVATTLAVVVLGESFTLRIAIGVMLIAAGVWTAARGGRQPEIAAPVS